MVEETYRNLYWIRIISLQNRLDEGINRWPLVDDIIESLNEID